MINWSQIFTSPADVIVLVALLGAMVFCMIMAARPNKREK